MVRIFLSSFVAILLLWGCSTTTGTVTADVAASQEPMYVDENTWILFALDAENQKKYAEAVGYYDLVYKENGDEVYADKAMDALIKGRYYNDALQRLHAKQEAQQVLSEKEQRYLVVTLLAKKDFTQAEVEAKNLRTLQNSEQNYLLSAEVYLIQKKYVEALALLEEGYKVDYSERILDKMSVIIYVNMKSPYEAIGRLKAHTKNFGYSLPITRRLATFYANQKDDKGLVEVYPHLYKLDPSSANASILVQLYWHTKEIQKLKALLEGSRTNDPLLLQIYTSEKHYVKAIVVAKRLYADTGDIEYLGQKAILEYENAPKKKSDAVVSSLIKDLKKVVVVKKEGYFLNYLGYCMLEHDRDITEGMAYVEEALDLEPESAYFIDSLAWGHYKQGECKKAAALMKKVVEIMGSDDEEVKAHLRAIKSCKEGKK